MLKIIKKFYKKTNLRIVSRILEPIGKNILYKDAKNIKRYLQRKALEETALFVSDNMQNVKCFSHKFELLKYSVSKLIYTDGLFLEFGVYSGTTINYIAKLIPEHPIYGFDSFEGLPEEWNALPKGAFGMKQLPKVQNNVELIKGWFDQTIPVFKQKENKHISFLHIDSDLYSSAKTIFYELDNQIMENTIIVFDEYFNYPGWKLGEYKAFLEYVEDKSIKFEYLGYCFNSEQVAIRIISKTNTNKN